MNIASVPLPVDRVVVFVIMVLACLPAVAAFYWGLARGRRYIPFRKMSPGEYIVVGQVADGVGFLYIVRDRRQSDNYNLVMSLGVDYSDYRKRLLPKVQFEIAWNRAKRENVIIFSSA